jgi:hypothetical protein
MSDARPATQRAGSAANLSLVIRADLYLDEHHGDFVGLGDRLFEAFAPVGDRISSQVRSLQQVATSATRFSDVEDFVKNQMGRGRATSRAWQVVGDEVLAQLNVLRGVPAGRPGEVVTPEEQLQFRLRLARGWVRSVVSHYLYRIATTAQEHSRD